MQGSAHAIMSRRSVTCARRSYASRLARALTLALTLLFTCVVAGCVSAQDAWSFRLSRDFYPEVNKTVTRGGADLHQENLGGRSAIPAEIGVIVVGVIAIPIIVDVVVLPVTGVHV